MDSSRQGPKFGAASSSNDFQFNESLTNRQRKYRKFDDDRKRAKKLLFGEEREADKFFGEYFPRLFRFAISRLGGDTEAARDIVQNTFSKTFLHIQKYRGESTLFTWMCSICRNEIYDYQARRYRRERVLVLAEDCKEVSKQVESAGAPCKDQPEQALGQDQKMRLIHTALDRLSARQGNVLEWKYIEGYTVNQIAEKLGISHSAVQSALARARQAFKQEYKALTGKELTDWLVPHE